MDKSRIKEILEVYRPGEGLESDPEVRQALERASEDPELSEWRQQSEEFDAVFSKKLKGIQAPASLYEEIIRNAPAPKTEPSVQADRKVLQWLHPAAFGAAAAIIILLALSFTYLKKPSQEPTNLIVQNELMPLANTLYASLNPTYLSQDTSKILTFLNNRGGVIPDALPRGFLFDDSFACDVIDLNGKTVSLICFKTEDDSNRLHLFTFLRSEFPMGALPSASDPVVNPGEKGASAVWADDDQIHVLFSDNGDKDLRKVLDI